MTRRRRDSEDLERRVRSRPNPSFEVPVRRRREDMDLARRIRSRPNPVLELPIRRLREEESNERRIRPRLNPAFELPVRRRRETEPEERNVRHRGPGRSNIYVYRISLYPGGKPQMFTFKIIRNVANLATSETELLDTLVRGIRRNVAARVGEVLYPNRRQRNYERVRSRTNGILVLTSLSNGGMTFARKFHRLSELTTEEVLEMIKKIQQSKRDENVFTLEYSYLVSPETYSAGGARKPKLNWLGFNKKFERTLEEHEDENGHINCAAYAINYAMNYLTKRYNRKNITDEMINRDARNLQSEMGWGDMVGIEEFEKFVRVYPEYRLTCFLNSKAENAKLTTYEGVDFDVDSVSESPTRKPEKAIYLYLDIQSQHYFAITSPTSMLVESCKSKSIKFCHYCICKYHKNEHDCETYALNQPLPLEKRKSNKCKGCGLYTKSKCDCEFTKCKTCNVKKKRGYDQDHRCIVLNDGGKEKEFTDACNGKGVNLWAYDFESRIEIIEEDFQREDSFELDEDGMYTGEVFMEYVSREHKVNLVVARNVFSGQEKIFDSENCLEEFIMFMINYNDGLNICVAHNASGYDTRLLFEKACRMDIKDDFNPILRGSKFIQFRIGKCIFNDSLLHLQGSLRSLAKDFCGEEIIEKGYFPHVFNTIENYDYVGPIPAKEYFDLPFSVSNEKDLQDFNEWYDTWQGRTDWNFMHELRKYCINDVYVLSKIMLSYHEILFSEYELSPWFSTTAASYIHKVYLKKVEMDLELPDEEDARYERIQDLAWNDTWAVLEQTEYWFARRALRGGRTDVRKIYHRVSDEEWLRGERIRYQDICSQYPYQQAVHEFPVGLPTIHVWDTSYSPCMKHKKGDGSCDCNNPIIDRSIKIGNKNEPTAEDIINDDYWRGIVCATVIPPKDMYHPIIVSYDEELGFII